MPRIEIEIDIQLPKPPNFLRYGPADSQVIDVADLTEEQMQAFTDAWVEQLLNHADKRRREKPEGVAKGLRDWVERQGSGDA